MDINMKRLDEGLPPRQNDGRAMGAALATLDLSRTSAGAPWCAAIGPPASNLRAILHCELNAKINESLALHTWHLRHFRHFRHLRRLPCHLAKPGVLRHFFRVQIIPSQPCRISLWAVIKATAQAALEVKSWCRYMTPTVCTLYTTLYHIYWICDWCDVLNYHTDNIWIIISTISGFFE